jgi:hypothetical protein
VWYISFFPSNEYNLPYDVRCIRCTSHIQAAACEPRFILSHSSTTLHIHLLASQHTNCALITMAFRGRSPPRLEGTHHPVIPYDQLTSQQLALYADVVHHIDHNTRLPTPSWNESYESFVFGLTNRTHFASGAMAPRHDWDAHRLWQLWRSSPQGPPDHVRINTRRYTLQQRAPDQQRASESVASTPAHPQVSPVLQPAPGNSPTRQPTVSPSLQPDPGNSPTRPPSTSSSSQQASGK